MKQLVRSLTTSIVATSLLTATSIITFAHDFKVGDLIIDHPVARATLPNAPVGGGYLTVKNNGAEDDRLIGGNASFAGKVEVHEMKMVDDVMKMRALKDGLLIPAGGEVTLKPGANHLMFMKLSERLLEGEKREAELVFEKAGTVTVTFNVEKITDHGHMKKDEHKDHSSHRSE